MSAVIQFTAEYRAGNAAELIVERFIAQRRRSISSRQSAAVVDEQSHHIIVVDDRRQLQSSHVVLHKQTIDVTNVEMKIKNVKKR